MNIKDFFAQKDNPPELFWSLILESDSVQAGAWFIKEGVAEVVAISPSVVWEEDGLISAVDASLSSCIQKLPEEYPDPTKTVFGVSPSWVEGGEIKEEYLGKIKKICSELSLTPSGFVVLPEAIAHLYKSEEGAPINAVVIGLGKENLEVSVFKLGTLVGTSVVSRSVSLVEDAIEGLSRFEGASPLPSRIVVFDGKENDLIEAKDALSGNSWEENEKIKFLHPPKVEALTPERKILATSLAGAAEIGQASKVESREIENIEEPEIPPTAEEMGFVVGNNDIIKEAEIVPEAKPEVKNDAPLGVIPPVKPKLPKFNFSAFNSKISNSLKFFNGMKAVTLIVTILVAILGIGLIWWFVPKATVSIYVEPRKFEKDIEITFDTQGSSDVSGGVLPGVLTSVKTEGEKTKSTTGTKLIGDRAKGSIKIGNSSSSDIVLKAGTLLSSSSGLNFTTDKQASISAAIDSFTPGIATLGVTAADIGAQYNLGNGEIFKVSNYPKAEVSAQATADFSGGSSREISAVGKDDQESLQSSLTDELKGKAIDELTAKVNSNEILVGDLVSFEPTDVTFDHKIGDEASTLKLDLSMEAKGILANKDKLNQLVKEKLRDEVPTGFVLRDTQISYKFTFKGDQNGKFIFDVNISVNFLPQVDEAKIIKNISGKTTSVVQNYLNSIPGYKKAKIFIRPHFPGIFGTLPRVPKNITIEVAAEK